MTSFFVTWGEPSGSPSGFCLTSSDVRFSRPRRAEARRRAGRLAPLLLLASLAHAQIPFEGRVQQVNPITVTVTHDAIPSWMGAMTMAYPVDKPDILPTLKPGDTIRATVYPNDTKLYQIQIVTGITLEQLEARALANHPALKQAEAAIAAARGRAQQAGLYPNPTISAVGEEISRGPIIRGGEIGGGIQQRIVMANKLGIARQAGEQERLIAEERARSERQRILNSVRSLFYQALGEQRLIQLRGQLSGLAKEITKISAEMTNLGQADRPDQLFAEVEAERLDLGLTTAQNALERTWRQLTAVVNDPALRPSILTGDFDTLPSINADAALQKIYAESPELRAAEVNTTRADLNLKRARRKPIPDLLIGGGVRYNRELLEFQANSALRRPVGTEGFFDVSIQIPLFNRNQGAIAEARADRERARLEVDRQKLSLQARLASVYREYRDAAATADRYRTRMIPKAQQAYDLYAASFRNMAAAYPQVLIAQRNLFQLQEEYVMALIAAHQHAVEIEGLLVPTFE